MPKISRQERLFNKIQKLQDKLPRETRGEIGWDKLDNAAHLFPAIAEEGMTNVYRLSVVLKEDIQPDVLYKAIEMVLPKFRIFNVRLRRGMFWFYFEENGKKPPKLKEENNYPCQYIVENKNNNYLFRISYYKKRINLEVFHSLTDGNGGYQFLKEIVYQYLRMVHKELQELYPDKLSDNTSLNREDSFKANFTKPRFESSYRLQRAFQLKGAHFPTGKTGIINAFVSVNQLKEQAKKYGASINEYIVSLFMWSIYREYLNGYPSKRPITISIPVNLRPYFDSITTKNFFVMVSALVSPDRKDMSFEDFLQSVKESLKPQLTKENLENVLRHNMTGQSIMILRTIPLVFKNPGLKQFYNVRAMANTTTVTNLGKIEVNPEYKDYIEYFGVMLSQSKGQSLKVALVSYEDVMNISISSTFRETRLQQEFLSNLAKDGLDITIETNGVYYG